MVARVVKNLLEKALIIFDPIFPLTNLFGFMNQDNMQREREKASSLSLYVDMYGIHMIIIKGKKLSNVLAES